MMLLFKWAFKSSDTLPKYGKVISKSFFSAINVTGFSVSYLLRKIFQFDRKCVLF